MSANCIHESGTAGRVSFILLFILLGMGLIPPGVALGHNLIAGESFNPACLDVASSNPWMPGGRDGRIDLADLAVFSYYWMMRDSVAPDPNPAQWGQRGGSVSGRPSPGATPTEIIMTAAPATDQWGWEVAYQFECVKIGDEDASVKSPWLYYPTGVDPTWTATGLQQDTTYTYVVRVAEIRVPGTLAEAGYLINPTGSTVIKPEDVSRDLPKSSNWTEPSEPVSATTAQQENGVPLPNPMTWAIAPVRVYINGQWFDFMQTSMAVDPEETLVEYQVREIQEGTTTPWRTESATYLGPDGNMYPGNMFWMPAGGQFTSRKYQCRARDTSPDQKMTDWSTPPLFPE